MLGIGILLFGFLLVNSYLLIVIWGEVIEIHKLIKQHISETNSK